MTVDGDFGPATEKAVRAFSELFGLPNPSGRVNAITWNAIVEVYEDVVLGSDVREGQYPGYPIG